MAFNRLIWLCHNLWIMNYNSVILIRRKGPKISETHQFLVQPRCSNFSEIRTKFWPGYFFIFLKSGTIFYDFWFDPYFQFFENSGPQYVWDQNPPWYGFFGPKSVPRSGSTYRTEIHTIDRTYKSREMQNQKPSVRSGHQCRWNWQFPNHRSRFCSGSPARHSKMHIRVIFDFLIFGISWVRWV